MTSLDVVHSFNFYALGVKADAVPLNDNHVTVTPTQIGTFRVQCTELCGLWHGNMADNTAMVRQPIGFRHVDPAADSARRAGHEVPAAIQPYVRARPIGLRALIVLNPQVHERMQMWTL